MDLYQIQKNIKTTIDRFSDDSGLTVEDLNTNVREILNELMKPLEGHRAYSYIGEVLKMLGILLTIQSRFYDPTKLDSNMNTLNEVIKTQASHETNLENEIRNTLQQFKRFDGLSVAYEDKILFFLGAGASNPYPSNIPTLSQLLYHLWEKADKMDSKPLKKLQTWCQENNISNIEEMLTAVTILNVIIENPKIAGLLNSVLYREESPRNVPIRDIDSIKFLDNTLNTFFSLLVGTMLSAKPNKIHQSLSRFVKKNQNVDVITTNYDGCIEQALDDQKIKYDYILNPSESSCLSLVKMHGSINWFYCTNCQRTFCPSIEELSNSSRSNLPYPITGICPKCEGVTRQFIIPPITHKYLTHAPIVQVWEEGRKKLKNAKVLVVIGYSFADADDYIAKMLVKEITEDPSKIVIVSNNDHTSIDRLRSVLQSRVTNYDIYNQFIDIDGDAVYMIPIIVRHLQEKLSSEMTKVPQ